MSGTGVLSVFTLDVTSTITTLLIPETGTYYIAAEGAQGGSGEKNVYGTESSSGGLGGEVAGYFVLVQGDTLEIAVGAAGSSPSSFETSYHVGAGGGGGASYVVLVNGPVDTLLEVAAAAAAAASAPTVRLPRAPMVVTGFPATVLAGYLPPAVAVAPVSMVAVLTQPGWPLTSSLRRAAATLLRG